MTAWRRLGLAAGCLAAVVWTGWIDAGDVVAAPGPERGLTVPESSSADPAPPVAWSQDEGRGGRQGQAAGRGRGRGGRGGGGNRGGAPIAFDDHHGFQQIFDGSSLDGWDGDPAFWRAEDGALVGESTAENPVTQNTFLIWRGGEPADFELKLQFRISSTNSGVQYRSRQLEASDEIGNWVLSGYQADIDYNNQYTGMLYEERGRGFLAPRGTFGYVGPNQPAGRGEAPASGEAGPRGQIGALDDSDTLRAAIRQDDWNQFHVIARGNVLVHVLNGHVTALFLDDDAENRASAGLIGLQIHTGAPMKVEFRDIWLKEVQ